MDISLINMPMGVAQRPSIALGLLQSILKKRGFSVKSYYASLWYLQFIGKKNFKWLEKLSVGYMMGDWLFGQSAFPDFSPNHDEYFSKLEQRAFHICNEIDGDFKEHLLKFRDQSTQFVEYVANQVLKDKPRIVGCTSMFSQHVATLAVLRRVKELDPSVTTLLGGANCGTAMGKATHQEFKWVDVVVSGEADDIIVPLCKSLLRQKDLFKQDTEKDFELLPKYVFLPKHRSEGYPKSPKDNDYEFGKCYALNTLPHPDYDDFFNELNSNKYKNDIKPALLFEASRGCWWGEKSHCTFCGVNGGAMVFRSKKPEHVFDEIVTQSEKYDCYNLEAVDNIIDMKYFDNVLPWLSEKNKPYNIFFETKANLKKEQVLQFYKAKIRFIQPGIESLNSEILKLIRKGCTAWQNIQLLKWCRQYGISVMWSIIYGFPGEEDEYYHEMSEIIPLLTHLQPGSPNNVVYERYSPYFNTPEEFNLKLKPLDLYDYIYPVTDQGILSELALTFYDVSSNPDDPFDAYLNILQKPGISALVRALINWNVTFDKNLEMLVAKEIQNGLKITDTRACATQRKYILNEKEKNVLNFCDEAIPKISLLQEIYNKFNYNEEETSRIIDYLVKHKLMIEVDKRILSLVLYDPVLELPKTEMPMGDLL